MGYKNICLYCKISFSQGNDIVSFNENRNCPKCREKMILVGHKFKPPKKSNDKAWEAVKLMIDNNFHYQSIYLPYENNPRVLVSIPYPKTLADAKAFLEKYEFGVPLKLK